MITSSKTNFSRSLRLSPLAACIALTFAGVAAVEAKTPLDKTTLSMAIDGHRALAAAANTLPPIVGATDPVTNCLDNGSAGSLRSVLATAANGDTIDLSGLTCSTITLTSGALLITKSPLTIIGPAAVPPAVGPSLTIDGNHNGRVIKSSGTLTIQQLGIANGSFTVADGRAPGGCIYVKTDISVIDSTVSGCNAAGAQPIGAGVYSFYGNVAITRSAITGNTVTAQTTAAGTEASAQATGGGVYSYLGMNITDSTISGNAAVVGTIANPATTTSAHAFGGGVLVAPTSYGNLMISGSTISGNSAEFAGGVYVGGTGTISNSTVSGNYASINGGGVRALNAYGMTLQNSTVAFNNSGSVGGFVASQYGDPTTVNSSIIANNTETDTTYAADMSAFAAITVAGANSLVMTSDVTITFTNAPLTDDPKLLPLADNGGLTQTHALDPTSPAIDKGNNTAALTNDQRGAGFPRTQGTATDIGAYEALLITDRIFADGFDGP